MHATRLAVAGDSVGGNMATVVALLAKRESGPRIAGQLLFYPVTNADFESSSYKQFADGPWLTKSAVQWFWEQYLPDLSLRNNPTAPPLIASTQQLRGLPPTLIIRAGGSANICRAGGLRQAQQKRSANTERQPRSKDSRSPTTSSIISTSSCPGTPYNVILKCSRKNTWTLSL